MSGGIDSTTIGWLLAATLALALTAQALRAGRRRSALNRELHELRRPLQVLNLAVDGPRLASPHASSALRLAGIALTRLDRAVNGGAPSPVIEPVDVPGLLRSATSRWGGRVKLSGGSLLLGRTEAPTGFRGDEAALAQALDNLIVNAIEHGGPRISVESRVRRGRLLVTVSDSGRGSRPPSRRETPAETLARLSGRRRRGHGLSVVRAAAGEHDGRFLLRRSERGTDAILDLPLQAQGESAA